jgi:hypothetical protein
VRGGRRRRCGQSDRRYVDAGVDGLGQYERGDEAGRARFGALVEALGTQVGGLGRETVDGG